MLIIVIECSQKSQKKKKKKKSFSLEKMWAYSTIQHLLKQSETDPDNITFKEKALNLSLTVSKTDPNYFTQMKNPS